MDALNMVVQVPSWAYDFCYYYLAVAAVVVVYSLYSLVQLFSLPYLVKKIVPVTSIGIALIISSVVTVLLTMMQFWVCRSALRPTTEKFAVRCSGTGDCVSVMGTQPADSTCSCGGRGLCGGCVMNNNMKPTGSDLAPLSG